MQRTTATQVSSNIIHKCFWQCRELLFITGAWAANILKKVLRKNTLWTCLTIMLWICIAKGREEVGDKITSEPLTISADAHKINLRQLPEYKGSFSLLDKLEFRVFPHIDISEIKETCFHSPTALLHRRHVYASQFSLLGDS